MRHRLSKRSATMWAVGGVTALLATFAVGVEAKPSSDGRPPNPYGGSWHPYASKYGSSQPVPLTVPMPDGVMLSGDAVYPTDLKTGRRAPGRFPVIVELTPYQRDSYPSMFAAYGYIAVQVNEGGT